MLLFVCRSCEIKRNQHRDSQLLAKLTYVHACANRLFFETIIYLKYLITVEQNMKS